MSAINLRNATHTHKSNSPSSKLRKVFTLLASFVLAIGAFGAGIGVVYAGVTLSQNIQIGSGTPDLTLDGDDLYVTGTAEVDGTLAAKTGGGATFVVAASDASARVKNQADYVADGIADNVEIQAAIDALPASGGKVVLSEGTFNTTVPIEGSSKVLLQGQGHRATIIQTATNGINVVEFHGTGITDETLVRDYGVTDLQIAGSGDPDSYGLSLLFADRGYFSNLHITGFDGHGIKGEVTWDNYFADVLVGSCGSTAQSEAAVLLANNATGNSNTNEFYKLRIEPFEYRALQVDVSAGAGDANLNVFVGLKVHGDSGVTNGDGIVVAGVWNFFTNTQIANVGVLNTAVIVTGDSNQFNNTIVEDGGKVFNLQSDWNMIDGIFANGGPSKEIDDGIEMSGDENEVSNITLLNLDGWGMTLSGSRNYLSKIIIRAADEQGVIITGLDNELHGVAPLLVGEVSGEAMEISGDNNRIFGGRNNGTVAKTIQFNAGADINRVIGARVAKAIIDNGTGNKFSEVDGYVTEASGTSTIPSGSTSVTVSHGLSVTPAAGDCTFVGAEDPTSSPGAHWIDTFTSTQMNLNVENDPGTSNYDVAWTCSV